MTPPVRMTSRNVVASPAESRCTPGLSISSMVGSKVAVQLSRAVDELQPADMTEQQSKWKVRHDVGVVAEAETGTEPRAESRSPARGDPNGTHPAGRKDGSSLQRLAASVASAAPRLCPVIHSGRGRLACSARRCARPVATPPRVRQETRRERNRRVRRAPAGTAHPR